MWLGASQTEPFLKHRIEIGWTPRLLSSCRFYDPIGYLATPHSKTWLHPYATASTVASLLKHLCVCFLPSSTFSMHAVNAKESLHWTNSHYQVHFLWDLRVVGKKGLFLKMKIDLGKFEDTKDNSTSNQYPTPVWIKVTQHTFFKMAQSE